MFSFPVSQQNPLICVDSLIEALFVKGALRFQVLLRTASDCLTARCTPAQLLLDAPLNSL
jgi:hypothetical protein